MRHPRSFAAGFALALALAGGGACGDPFGLPKPNFANVVDTVSLYALTGTPIASASAYRIDFRQTVRSDQTTNFDFAFDIDTAGRAVLLPTGAVGLGRGSGVQLSGVEFDSVALAPESGYELDSAVAVTVASVALLRSRPNDCDVGLSAVYHFYAKLQVLAVDTLARRIDFQILVDTNCGYRGLEPGLPSR